MLNWASPPNGKVYVRINVGAIMKTPKEFSYSLVLNRSFNLSQLQNRRDRTEIRGIQVVDTKRVDIKSMVSSIHRSYFNSFLF